MLDFLEDKHSGGRHGAKKDKWRSKKRVEKGIKTCFNCGSTETPLWRRNYCNACALYKKHHCGEDRPLDMQMRPKHTSTSSKKTPKADREHKDSSKSLPELKPSKPTRINPPREKRRVGSIVDPGTPLDDDDEDGWESPPPPAKKPRAEPAPAKVAVGSTRQSVKREAPAPVAVAAAGANFEPADAPSFPLQVRSSYCSGPKPDVEHASVTVDSFGEGYGMPLQTQHTVSGEMFIGLWGEDQQYAPISDPSEGSVSRDSPSSFVSETSMTASVSTSSGSNSSCETKMMVPEEECGVDTLRDVSGPEVSVDDWLQTLSWN